MKKAPSDAGGAWDTRLAHKVQRAMSSAGPPAQVMVIGRMMYTLLCMRVGYHDGRSA
jgi:hypothetical protein